MLRLLRSDKKKRRSGEIFPQNGLVSEGTLVEGFNTVADWTKSGGTLEKNVTEYRTGSGSLKQTTPSGGTSTMDKAISVNFGSAPRLRVSFYCHNALPSDVSTFRLYLGSISNLTKNFAFNFYINSVQPGWNTYDIYPESSWVNTSDSWASTMLILRMRLTAASGKVFSVSWDEITVNPITKPAVLMTFDDCYSTVYSVAYAYMKSKSIKGSYYVIPGIIGQNLQCTASQIQEMYADGWDIGTHGSVNLTTLTQAQAEAEITANKNALDALGVSRATSHVAYPYSAGNETVYAAMAALGMLTGRLGSNGSVPNATIMDAKYRIYSCASLSGDVLTLAAMQAIIDKIAEANGRIGVIYGHNFATPGGVNTWTAADFCALIDYIISKNITFLTISQFYALQSGAIKI